MADRKEKSKRNGSVMGIVRCLINELAFVVRPLGGSLYATRTFLAEYKLPPKGRTTNARRQYSNAGVSHYQRN